MTCDEEITDSSSLMAIGDEAWCARARRALRHAELSSSNSVVEGLWRAGQMQPAGVLLQLPVMGDSLSALRNLRRVAPRARIVVACPPAHEPLALLSIHAGANDYVIDPAADDELAALFPPAQAAIDAERATPTHQPGGTSRDVVAMSEILRIMDGGAQPALDRLAVWIQSDLRATGVTLEVDGVRAATGGSEITRSHPIHRDDVRIGLISIGLPGRGADDSQIAARLEEFSRLAEVVSLQSSQRRRWAHLAWMDEVTELRNRGSLEEALEIVLRRAVKRRARVSLVLVEIQNLLEFGDEAKHALRRIADVLRCSTREADLLGRCGDDGFAVVLWGVEPAREPDSDHPRDVTTFLARLRDQASRFPEESGPARPIRLRGGIATFPWEGGTRAALMAAAERSLANHRRDLATIAIAPTTDPHCG